MLAPNNFFYLLFLFLFNIADEDYNSLSMEKVVFQPNSTGQCIIISTTPEDILESNEALTVLLETSDTDVNIGLNTTTITIGNDDCK